MLYKNDQNKNNLINVQHLHRKLGPHKPVFNYNQLGIFKSLGL